MQSIRKHVVHKIAPRMRFAAVAIDTRHAHSIWMMYL